MVAVTDDSEYVAYAGDELPMYPAWSENGELLVVSISGSIYMFKPGGQLRRVSSGNKDVLPVVEDGQIVYTEADTGRQIAAEIGSDEFTTQRVSFDKSRITNHPALRESAARAVNKGLTDGVSALGEILVQREFGDYIFQIRADNHQLDHAPCVYTNDKVPHVNITIYKNGDEALNLHAGQYKENGEKCYVAWENEILSDFCINTCDNDQYNPDDLNEWVAIAVDAFADALETAKQNGNLAAKVALTALLAIGIKTVVDLIITAWLVPFVPPPP